jgi:hypothetical protein
VAEIPFHIINGDDRPGERMTRNVTLGQKLEDVFSGYAIFSSGSLVSDAVLNENLLASFNSHPIHLYPSMLVLSSIVYIRFLDDISFKLKVKTVDNEIIDNVFLTLADLDPLDEKITLRSIKAKLGNYELVAAGHDRMSISEALDIEFVVRPKMIEPGTYLLF